MRKVLSIAAVVLILMSGARAQTRPATAPAAQTGAPSGGGLDQALTELKAGKNKEAQITAQAAITAAGRTLPAKLTDPALINLHHVLAVASYRLGEIPKARTAMDKVRASGKTNWSIDVNDSLIDIAIKSNQSRGAGTLVKALNAGPGTEPLINALGWTVNELDNNTATHGRALVLAPEYKKFEATLTPPMPGMTRWGNQWIDKEKAASIADQKRAAEMRRKDAETALNDRRSKLESVQRTMNTLQENYNKARQRDARAQRPGALDQAEQQYQQRLADYKAAELAVKNAPADPKPEYVAPGKIDVEIDLVK